MQTDEVMTKPRDDEDVPCLTSKRWIFAYIGIVAFMFVHAVRTDISVAVVCMVKVNASETATNASNVKCQSTANGTTGYERGEFTWSKWQQSGLLSAFYYGYLFAQIPGGWLAGRIGGKRVLGVGWTLGAICTILHPVGARASIYILFGLRVAVGFFTGVSFPAIQSMLGRWAPPAERSKLISVVFTGPFIGNIITFSVSGYLCAEGFDNGWGSIFYVVGGTHLFFLIFWFLFVSESPSDHPSISLAEKNYIINSIGDSPQHVTSIPWRGICTSRPFYACVICHTSFSWVVYTILAQFPTFLKEVLFYDVKTNGVLSAVPFIAMSVTSLLSGQIADYLRQHHFSTKAVRRLFQCVSFIGVCASIIATGFVTCENRSIAIVLMCVAFGFLGLASAGFLVNYIEFAPRYAGILFGISNFFATFPGMTAPLVAGALTPNNTEEEWRVVFYLCGAFSVVGAVVFGCFSEFEVQTWARGSDDGRLDKFEKCIQAATDSTNTIHAEAESINDIHAKLKSSNAGNGENDKLIHQTEF